MISAPLEAVPVVPAAGSVPLEEAHQTSAARTVNVQTMTWDFPIQILPTYPAHITKGFQMASIGSLNV